MATQDYVLTDRDSTVLRVSRPNKNLGLDESLLGNDLAEVAVDEPYVPLLVGTLEDLPEHLKGIYHMEKTAAVDVGEVSAEEARRFTEDTFESNHYGEALTPHIGKVMGLMRLSQVGARKV